MLTAGQKKRIRKWVIFDYDRVEICSCWGKISRQQEVLLTEERPYPHLLLHRSAGPALPQPVDNLLRNAPCQCTAHATARADIGFFKSECFSRTGTFFLNKHEISNKK